MRRVWIEITYAQLEAVGVGSPSMRRVWIEIYLSHGLDYPALVTLHAEGVD